MSQMCDLPNNRRHNLGTTNQTTSTDVREASGGCSGKGWELYAEGQKLQSESTAFRKKLDTRPVYDVWLHDINRRNMGVDGRLFEIVRLCSGGFQLAVNFDPQTITLFKEVWNLLWLNFQVPHAITNMAKDAKRVYSHAVSLMEMARTYV